MGPGATNVVSQPWSVRGAKHKDIKHKVLRELPLALLRSLTTTRGPRQNLPQSALGRHLSAARGNPPPS